MTYMVAVFKKKMYYVIVDLDQTLLLTTAQILRVYHDSIFAEEQMQKSGYHKTAVYTFNNSHQAVAHAVVLQSRRSTDNVVT